MKAFFPKGSVHPASESGTGTPGEKAEVSLIIPITSELNYFERRLNNQGNLTEFEPLSELNNFFIRKYRRSSENLEDAFKEPCKYEVLTSTGQLVYFIAEQTEYFVRGTTCLSKPQTIELNVMTPGGDSVMKYFVEFGNTGYITKVKTIQKDRTIGSVHRPFRFIFPNRYSIRDSSDQTIINIKPKDSFCTRICKFNLFSPTSSTPINQFDIYSSSSRSRKKPICKGKIQRDLESEIESYSLTLFHGVDILEKSLLISAVILNDLQKSPRRKTRIFNCHILSCLPQFAATICFYLIFLVILGTFVMLIAVTGSTGS